MNKYELTPDEQRFVDLMVGAFALVEAVEGTESAAEFVTTRVMNSTQIITESNDRRFLAENGIDPSTL